MDHKAGSAVRRRQPFILMMLSILVTGFASSTAHGVGFGMDTGSASEQWDEIHGAEDRTATHFGALFDTAVAKKSIFSYRTVLALEVNAYDEYGLKFSGTTMVHNFNFTLVQDKIFKLWMGPHLKFAAYNQIEYVNPVYDDQYDGFIRGYGGGITLGCNFNIKKLITLGLSGGNRYMRYEGHYEQLYPYYTSTPVRREVNADVSSSFIGISLIFRINDQY